MKNFILGFFSGASGKLRLAVCAVILSALAIRFPILTAWLGETIQHDLMRVAEEIRTWGYGFVLLFCKQFNASGGTVVADVETKVEKANP